MTGKNTSVFGIYPDRTSVEEAIDAFKAAGFRNTDISVLLPENVGSKDFAHEKHTKAPEGAATGATSGAVIGGALGWLAGIGAITIPGLQPLLAAGPVVALLAGLGALGTAGGIAGGLIGLGMPEYEAKRYEGRVKKGGILLSVHCDDADWTKQARELMKRTGAEDVSTSGEAAADYGTSDKPVPRTRTVSSLVDGRHSKANVTPVLEPPVEEPPRTRAAGGWSSEVE